eukprot:5337380-Alexandrium_andersonii.AAC.1
MEVQPDLPLVVAKGIWERLGYPLPEPVGEFMAWFNQQVDRQLAEGRKAVSLSPLDRIEQKASSSAGGAA